MKVITSLIAWAMIVWAVAISISGLDFIITGDRDSLIMVQRFLFIPTEQTKVYKNDIVK